jgi:HK97 family phage portal protein
LKLFGFEIARAKAAPPSSAYPVAENRGNWISLIKEPFTGAWQRNIHVDRQSVLSYHAVYACITLIAGDVAKLRCKLMELSAGIWTETESAAFSPVLRKPNPYQNRIQFWEAWIISKLTRGNTYVLKVRDNRGIVTALYVLDPNRVKVLVSDDGSVWYQLSADNVSSIETEVMVPASEIIHDRFNCLFHPLIGVSPIFAAGAAAMQGVAIQNDSASFFANRSQPGGILTAPGEIGQEDADRLKEAWSTKYTGENAGKIAVVGNGLTYTAIGMSAHDSQLIEQLKWTAEVVCSVFHVPAYKIGIGQMPPYTNVQALNVEYYSQGLQYLIEAAELCMDEGLGIGVGNAKPNPEANKPPVTYGTEFDLDGLLRMDSVTQMEVLDKGKNILKPDEARKKLDLPPVPGGDQVYRQQQEFSLAALAKRDALADPFGKAVPPPANDAQAAAKAEEAAQSMRRIEAYQVLAFTRRKLAHVRR